MIIFIVICNSVFTGLEHASVHLKPTSSQEQEPATHFRLQLQHKISKTYK